MRRATQRLANYSTRTVDQTLRLKEGMHQEERGGVGRARDGPPRASPGPVVCALCPLYLGLAENPGPCCGPGENGTHRYVIVYPHRRYTVSVRELTTTGLHDLPPEPRANTRSEQPENPPKQARKRDERRGLAGPGATPTQMQQLWHRPGKVPPTVPTAPLRTPPHTAHTPHPWPTPQIPTSIGTQPPRVGTNGGRYRGGWVPREVGT